MVTIGEVGESKSPDFWNAKILEQDQASLVEVSSLTENERPARSFGERKTLSRPSTRYFEVRLGTMANHDII